MWVTGFEPAQALSHRISSQLYGFILKSRLSPARLTTPAHPHTYISFIKLINVFNLRFAKSLLKIYVGFKG